MAAGEAPRLIRVYVVKGSANVSCQDCGHAIRECYVVQIGDAERTVGSECVKAVLGIGGNDAERYQRRIAAARRQWKKQEPAPLEGEDQSDYINRRVREMNHAGSAYRMMTQVVGRYLYDTLQRRVWARGIYDSKSSCVFCSPCPGNYDTCKCQRCIDLRQQRSAFRKALDEEKEALISEIETAHSANRYDFWQRPAYRLP